jgi:ubiquinone/menaquinone biosynthesis C-methylase UbiE
MKREQGSSDPNGSSARRTEPARICDYEGSPYRSEFWDEADRGFEDAAERAALDRMLPPTGVRIVEIGAGFGRLADLYRGYDEIILLDYAHSMLIDAHSRIAGANEADTVGTAPKFRFVCADLYRLPFASSALDTVVQIRVLHHVEQVPRALAEVARVLAAGGNYVLEFANKRNLKALLRYALRKQSERPFDHRPHEFVELNWNFHPDYVAQALREAGLEPHQQRAVSHFRHPALKRSIGSQLLARADAAIGGPLARLALAPSQFVRSIKGTGGPRSDRLWRCPKCGAEPLAETAEGVPCTGCGMFWPKIGGIYIFREDAISAAGQ